MADGLKPFAVSHINILYRRKSYLFLPIPEILLPVILCVDRRVNAFYCLQIMNNSARNSQAGRNKFTKGRADGFEKDIHSSTKHTVPRVSGSNNYSRPL